MVVPDGVVVQTVVVVTGALTGVDGDVDFTVVGVAGADVTVVCVAGVVEALGVVVLVCDVVVVVAEAPALLCARYVTPSPPPMPATTVRAWAVRRTLFR